MKSLAKSLILIIFLSSCYSTSKISNRNLVFMYEPGSNFINPKYKVQHTMEGKSVLHFKFDSSDLLYMNKNDNRFEADFKISIEIYSSFESKQVLDTVSKTYHIDSKPEKESEIYQNIEFGNIALVSYLAKVTLQDINRNNNVVSFINVNKGNENLSQYFLLRKESKPIPLFRNHVASSEGLIIKHANRQTNTLWVKYFNRRFPLAAPPHTAKGAQIFSFVADSTYSININETQYFTKPGIYHIQKDTLQKNGTTVFRLHNDFPNLTEANQLLEPLRYLTTKNEYKKIQLSSDKRKAIDRYWLNMAGNKERARFLIKSYYNRVQTSNKYFTSYLEGWKSDRGLIYIIFGLPNGIYKTNTSEVWSYTGMSNASTLNFNFKRISNPFSDNDYVLVRKPEFEYEWYRSVETWRKGRIVNP